MLRAGSRRAFPYALALSVCAVVTALGFAVWQPRFRKTKAQAHLGTFVVPTILNEELPVDERLLSNLGGESRYQTFIATDKPIYRGGEELYARAVILHHSTHQPLDGSIRIDPEFQIIGPKGETIQRGRVAVEDSTAGFNWKIPAEQVGGQYTIKVAYPLQGFASAERKVEIRAYRTPRLKMQIKFLRDGYGPGDEVVAMLEASRAEGGYPVGAKVSVNTVVDGVDIATPSTNVDTNGKAVVRFRLPTQMQRGEGTVVMTIEDGGTVESSSKTIPILLQTVDLNLYPEGGDLVAGLKSRVYIEARTPANKPADFAGVVLDSTGRPVTEFKTEHEGRGRFELLPGNDESYTIQITQPSGIKTNFKLPQVHATGATVRSLKDVFASSEPIQLEVATTHRQGYVTLSKRERVLKRIELNSFDDQPHLVEFDQLPSAIDGVLIATVWKDAQSPMAERLVFRQPSKDIRIEIMPAQTKLTPGSQTSVRIRTTDENGAPKSALVGVSVCDESVAELLDKREQPPRLPVQVLLESEVSDLADAWLYFDPQVAHADRAMDLLLGTQGWRRFAVMNPTEFLARCREHGQLVLAYRWENPSVVSSPDASVRSRPAKMLDVVDSSMDVFSGLAKRPNQLSGAAVDGRSAKDQKRSMHPSVSRAMGLPELSRPVQAAGIAGMGSADMISNMAMHSAVRVYAHQVSDRRATSQRIDFTETLFWSAGLRTDEKGEATFGFALNDSITSFRIAIDGVSADGALGANATSIQSIRPFYIDAKVPLEVSVGDTVELPITAVNASPNPLPEVSGHVSVSHAKVQYDPSPLSMNGDSRRRRLATVEIGPAIGIQTIDIFSQSSGSQRGSDGASDKVSDSLKKTLMVRPLGLPIEHSQAGLLVPGQTAQHEFTISEELVAGSMETRVIVYPSPLASLTGALERLIQEPSGCFEQTSSTTYPLVMAQQYFMSHHSVDPAIVERAASTLHRGYHRLMGYECKSGGFEWFGRDPGHDALTAYGLMQFTDMSKVREVDPKMLQRTTAWLLAQRDGEGGFVRKASTLHSWLADAEVANTYNLWALMEAHVDADLSKEIDRVRTQASQSSNSYVLALAANVLALAEDSAGEARLLNKLAQLQQPSGGIGGATTSVIGSEGESLDIETTSLATLAWLRRNEFGSQVDRAIKYLSEHCQAGRFGSTQATVLALRAIVAYDATRSIAHSGGELQLLIDGEVIGETVKFAAGHQAALELPAFTLGPGKHSLAVRMIGGSQMPYSATVKYHRLKPASSEFCKVNLQTRLTKNKLTEGDAVDMAVTMINQHNSTVPTPMAIIGIPGGLEVRHDQLKELVAADRIAAYEVRGREVILYWRALPAEARLELSISLVAAIPGKYTAPASRAYLYYSDEFKQWIHGESVTIAPLPMVEY